MKILLVLIAAMMLSSCSSPLEKEWKKVQQGATATSAAQAEAALDEAEKFVARIGRFKNPPAGLLEKARALEKKRKDVLESFTRRHQQEGDAAEQRFGNPAGPRSPVDPTSDTPPQERGWR